MTHSFASTALHRVVERAINRHRPVTILASTIHVSRAVPTDAPAAKVIDLIDAYSSLWRSLAETRRPPWSWLDRLEAARLVQYESTLDRVFDCGLVVADSERDELKSIVGDLPLVTIGNGVDLDEVRPTPHPPTNRPNVIFIGQMDYYPNVDAVRTFCTEVWPRIHQRLPEARFTIVGRNPTRAVRALANDPTVDVTGTVADVQPYLAGAWVVVAPFALARGVQNKILEALAAGVPVVATTVALDGLGSSIDAAVRRADGAEDCAREVFRLLNDAEWRQHWATAGRTYVERHHRWDELGDRLCETLTDLNRSDHPPRVARAGEG